MRPQYYAQLSRKGGSWFATITIEALGNSWTSKPVMLDAETEAQAEVEVARQVMDLQHALEG